MEFGSSHIYFVPPDQPRRNEKAEECIAESSLGVYDQVPLLDEANQSSNGQDGVIRLKEKNGPTKKKKKRKQKTKEKKSLGMSNPAYESLPTNLTPSAPTMYTLLRDVEKATPSHNHQHQYDIPPPDDDDDVDTNIISVKLGVVADHEDSVKINKPPNLCSNCNAVVVDTNQQMVSCRFCEHLYAVSADAWLADDTTDDVTTDDVTYVLESSDRNIYMNTDESLVVFCIDTSGSMCVTREVHGSQFGVGGYISRLQSVKDAVIRQIRGFEEERPSTHVAVVVFNNEVEIYGDGSVHICLQDCQTEDEDYLSSVVRGIPPLNKVCSSADRLCQLVESLTENGATALGPALFVSCQLTQRYTSSQVVLCTDGRANIGVGSLQSEADYKNCHYFYDQISARALQHGAVVSIMSIGGSDCRLVELGKVAHKTSGKVRKLDVEDVEMEMKKLVDDRPIASDVTVQVVTSKLLYFPQTDTDMLDSRECAGMSNITTKYIGNITAESEVAFRYGINNNIQDQLPPQLPFQLHIFYRSLDGSKQLRVITQHRPLTDDLKLAESDMNPIVIGTFAAQSCGKLALQGEVDLAQQVNRAHRALLERGMASTKSRRSSVTCKSRDEKSVDELLIYGQVRAVMEEVDVQLDKASKVLERPQVADDSDVRTPSNEGEYLAPIDQPPMPMMRKKFQDRPLPEIPTQANPGTTAYGEDILSKLSPPNPKLKRRKKSTRAERYDDRTAQQIYEFSSLHSCKFATNPS